MAEKLCYLDAETTGLYPNIHGMWQFSCFIEINRKIVEGFQMEIAPFPQDVIDPKSLMISNKTVEYVKALKDPYQGYQVLLKFLNKHVNRFDKSDKLTVVAYNATFDMSFLREFFKKADPIQGQFFGSYFKAQPIDVYTVTSMMQWLGKFSLPNLKLQTVASHFGITYEAHQARDDVKTMRKVFYECLRQLNVLTPEEFSAVGV